MDQSTSLKWQSREANALALLLGMQDEGRTGMGVEVLIGSLKSRLDMPLSDLGKAMPWMSRRVRRAMRQLPGGVKTVDDLLAMDDPPMDLLRAVKSYAKLGYHDPLGAMQKEVALMLYHAAIAVALMQHDEVITSLKRPRLIRSFNSRLSRPWIAPQLEELFHDALTAMGANAHDEPLGKIAEIKSGTGSTAA